MYSPNLSIIRRVRVVVTASLVAALVAGLLPPSLAVSEIHPRLTTVPFVDAFFGMAWPALFPPPTTAFAADVALPYTESFDLLTPNTTDVPTGWVQVTGDGNDTSCTGVAAACNNWIVDNNGTPSNNTGPSSDHTGSGNYLYVEASNNSNRTVELQSPSFDLQRHQHARPHLLGSSL
ncbi:MAG: hypothetical protein R2867_16245 [Caldilineaceae bacterium]